MADDPTNLDFLSEDEDETQLQQTEDADAPIFEIGAHRRGGTESRVDRRVRNQLAGRPRAPPQGRHEDSGMMTLLPHYCAVRITADTAFDGHLPLETPFPRAVELDSTKYRTAIGHLAGQTPPRTMKYPKKYKQVITPREGLPVYVSPHMGNRDYDLIDIDGNFVPRNRILYGEGWNNDAVEREGRRLRALREQDQRQMDELTEARAALWRVHLRRAQMMFVSDNFDVGENHLFQPGFSDRHVQEMWNWVNRENAREMLTFRQGGYPASFNGRISQRVVYGRNLPAAHAARLSQVIDAITPPTVPEAQLAVDNLQEAIARASLPDLTPQEMVQMRRLHEASVARIVDRRLDEYQRTVADINQAPEADRPLMRREFANQVRPQVEEEMQNLIQLATDEDLDFRQPTQAVRDARNAIMKVLVEGMENEGVTLAAQETSRDQEEVSPSTDDQTARMQPSSETNRKNIQYPNRDREVIRVLEERIAVISNSSDGRPIEVPRNPHQPFTTLRVPTRKLARLLNRRRVPMCYRERTTRHVLGEPRRPHLTRRQRPCDPEQFETIGEYRVIRRTSPGQDNRVLDTHRISVSDLNRPSHLSWKHEAILDIMSGKVPTFSTDLDDEYKEPNQRKRKCIRHITMNRYMGCPKHCEGFKELNNGQRHGAQGFHFPIAGGRGLPSDVVLPLPYIPRHRHNPYYPYTKKARMFDAAHALRPDHNKPPEPTPEPTPAPENEDDRLDTPPTTTDTQVIETEQIGDTQETPISISSAETESTDNSSMRSKSGKQPSLEAGHDSGSLAPSEPDRVSSQPKTKKVPPTDISSMRENAPSGLVGIQERRQETLIQSIDSLLSRISADVPEVNKARQSVRSYREGRRDSPSLESASLQIMHHRLRMLSHSPTTPVQRPIPPPTAMHTPVETAPAQSGPTETLPTATQTPVETTPAQSGPTETLPTATQTPVKTAPAQSGPTETLVRGPTPSEVQDRLVHKLQTLLTMIHTGGPDVQEAQRFVSALSEHGSDNPHLDTGYLQVLERRLEEQIVLGRPVQPIPVLWPRWLRERRTSPTSRREMREDFLDRRSALSAHGRNDARDQRVVASTNIRPGVRPSLLNSMIYHRLNRSFLNVTNLIGGPVLRGQTFRRQIARRFARQLMNDMHVHLPQFYQVAQPLNGQSNTPTIPIVIPEIGRQTYVAVGQAAAAAGLDMANQRRGRALQGRIIADAVDDFWLESIEDTDEMHRRAAEAVAYMQLQRTHRSQARKLDDVTKEKKGSK